MSAAPPATARIRAATGADAPALAALRYEFRIAEAPGVECAKSFGRRCTEWMSARLDDTAGAWRCWVAEVEGRLVGHLWIQLIEKIPNPVAEPERHAYITNVYVRPGYRNHGLGAQLMNTSLAWAREREVDAVFLWRTDASASLYERFGFTAPARLIERRAHERDVG